MSEDPTVRRTDPVFTERCNGRAVAVHGGSEPQRRVRYATEYRLDGSDPESPEEVELNGWLQRNLESELDIMTEAISALIAERDEKIAELERKVERLTGALDVLTVGRMMRVRGTYDADVADSYKQLDIVILSGSSFIATEDRPGACPGPHWQLLASCGSRGQRGRDGAKGEKGDPAPAAATIRGLHIDPTSYTLSVLVGRKLHQLNLRSLFQHFFNEALRSLR